MSDTMLGSKGTGVSKTRHGPCSVESLLPGGGSICEAHQSSLRTGPSSARLHSAHRATEDVPGHGDGSRASP